MNNFYNDLNFSNQSTIDVTEYFNKQISIDAVESVQHDKHYQKIGIDLILKCNNRFVSVEIKSDRYRAKNMVFETESNVNTCSIGCFLYSEADLWAYHFVNEGVMYLFDHTKALSIFRNKYSNIKSILAGTTVGNSFYQTKCTLINIKDLETQMRQEKAFFEMIKL